MTTALGSSVCANDESTDHSVGLSDGFEREFGVGFRSRSRSSFGVPDRVAVRALCRRLVRDVDGCSSVGRCGLPLGRGAGAPGRLLVEGGRLVGGQLRACGSPLRCAWCGWFQWREFVGRASWFSGRHVEGGGWFLHSVLTVPHRRSDELDVLLGWLWSAWSGLRHVRGLGRVRRLLGASPVVVLQVRWSPTSGWHPHFHVVWFCSGDRSLVDGFGSVLGEAWSGRVLAVSGRRSSSLHAVHSNVVRNRWGVWEYLRPDHERHPGNDCLHPDHGGCGRCDTGSTDGWFLDPGSDDGWSRSPGGLEVFSGLGLAAVGGDRRAQALLAEYLFATRSRRRVLATAHLVRRFGSPPEPAGRATGSGGGPRLWVSAAVAGAVELAPHKRRVSPLHDGVVLAGSGDVVGAARLWSQVSGRVVVADVAADDGAPLLRFADESIDTSEGVSVMSDVVVETNGDHPPVGTDESRAERMVRAMLSRYVDNPVELTAGLDAAAGSSRTNEAKAARDRLLWFHRAVAVSSLRGEWVEVLLGRYEAGTDSVEVSGWLWSAVAELEGWSR